MVWLALITPETPAEKLREYGFAVIAALFALGVFLLFREAPELGDDLDYWGLAFDLLAGIPDAWSVRSFHDLRWPVWGPIWLAQAAGLGGLVSYYAAPLAYFVGTVVLVFLLARTCRCDRWLALAAVVFYALHPYQDTVFSRPMPDLSEGFWAASALLCWMRGRDRRLLLALCGVCLWLAGSNRITGVFIAAALGLAVVLCEPRRWRELAFVAGVALAGVMVEWTFWAWRTGDFLAVIHANLGGRGRAGTGPMPAWELPIRFLMYLVGGAWQFTLSSALLIGLIAARTVAPLRLVCLVALVWWLAISCAVQDLDPLRPMLRTSGRFLAGLAPLLAVIGAGGLAAVATMLPVSWRRWGELVLAGVVVVLAVVFLERKRSPETYPAEIAQVIGQTPSGTKILADPPMRHVALLCNEPVARTLQWDVQKQMVVGTPELDTAAARADEVWFFRSKIWNWVLADLRSGKMKTVPRLAPYLEPPYAAFWPRCVITHGQLAEFCFLSRGRPTALTEVPLSGVEFPTMLDRKSFPKERKFGPEVPLQRGMEGGVAAVHFASDSEDREPLMIWLEFLHGGSVVERLEFEPPGFPSMTGNTYFFEIPAGCDAWQGRVQARKTTRIESLRVMVGSRAPTVEGASVSR